MADKEVLPEWWNMDSTLADLIADKLKIYLDSSMSVPSDQTRKDWHDKIASIINRLERYLTRMEQPFVLENEIVRDAQAALKDLAEIFPALWD